jgi:hypothetical protein
VVTGLFPFGLYYIYNNTSSWVTGEAKASALVGQHNCPHRIQPPSSRNGYVYYAAEAERVLFSEGVIHE